MAAEFIVLDELLLALHGSIVRAGQRIAEERDSEIQYTIGECTLAFPAELQMTKGQVLARCPPPAESENAMPPEANLARLTISLKPAIALEGRR
jgi:hypothetical protein